MMPYLLKLVLSSLLLCGTYFGIQPRENLSETYKQPAETKDFDFDSVSFDEEDDYEFMNEYLDTTGMDHISRAVNPVEIMVILNALGIPAVLQEPLFCFSA